MFVAIDAGFSLSLSVFLPRGSILYFSVSTASTITKTAVYRMIYEYLVDGLTSRSAAAYREM